MISHWYLCQYKSNSNRSWFIRLLSLRASKWPIYYLIIYRIGEDKWSWQVLDEFSSWTNLTQILQGSGRAGRFLTRSPSGSVSKSLNPTRPWLMTSLIKYVYETLQFFLYSRSFAFITCTAYQAIAASILAIVKLFFVSQRAGHILTMVMNVHQLLLQNQIHKNKMLLYTVIKAKSLVSALSLSVCLY